MWPLILGNSTEVRRTWIKWALNGEVHNYPFYYREYEDEQSEIDEAGIKHVIEPGVRNVSFTSCFHSNNLLIQGRAFFNRDWSLQH